MLKKLKTWLFKKFAFGLEANSRHSNNKHHHCYGGNIDKDINASKHADAKQAKYGASGQHGDSIETTSFLANFGRKLLALYWQ